MIWVFHQGAVMRILRNWLPYEATTDSWLWCGKLTYQKHLDDEVVVEFDGRYHQWPGTHKNVLNWCRLKTGYIVGWNENGGRGWTFIIRKDKT